MRKGEVKWFMISRYAEAFVGWVVCGMKSIEKPVELAFPNKTDVTDLHAAIRPSRTWLPQGMSVTRILYSKLIAIYVVMSHRGL